MSKDNFTLLLDAIRVNATAVAGLAAEMEKSEYHEHPIEVLMCRHIEWLDDQIKRIKETN